MNDNSMAPLQNIQGWGEKAARAQSGCGVVTKLRRLDKNFFGAALECRDEWMHMAHEYGPERQSNLRANTLPGVCSCGLLKATLPRSPYNGPIVNQLRCDWLHGKQPQHNPNPP